MEYTCTYCSKKFTPKYRPAKPETPFCSLSCSVKHQHIVGKVFHPSKKNYTCFLCKREFEGYPSNKERPFCSRSCAATFNNTEYVKRRKETTGKQPRARVYKPRTRLLEHQCETCGNPAYKLYCSSLCSIIHRKRELCKAWLETGVLQDNIYQHPPKFVREHILAEQENRCAICSQGVAWNNQPLTLILDHIDGNSTNSCRGNLRMICPNCDTQLPTFKSRNKKSMRQYRRKRYAEGQTY